MPKYKQAALTVQEVKDGGSVVAYASTFDREPDSYGDVIAPGAFDKTIERWKGLGKPVPLLWAHDTYDPMSNIGACREVGTDERGLRFDADFDADNPKAQYIRKLISEGRVFQCSFAYDVRDAAEVELEDGRKAMELREIELYEISIVQIPANQHAEVLEVKSALDAALDVAAQVKAGRRNSKKDEDAIRQAIALLQGVLGEMEDEPGEEDPDEKQSDAGETKDAAEGGEGKAMPEGREDAPDVLEAYKQALLSAYQTSE